MRIETLEIETGGNRAKLIKTIGVCGACGYQAYPLPNRWKFKDL